MKIIHVILFSQSFFFSSFAFGKDEPSDAASKKNQVFILSLNFNNEQPLPFGVLKTEIINLGFDWSSIIGYSIFNKSIYFFTELRKPRIDVKHGLLDLEKILVTISKRYSYDVKMIGFFQLNDEYVAVERSSGIKFLDD